MTLQLVQPVSFVETQSLLRGSDAALMEMVEELCERIELVEPHVQAFVPEEGRRERLRRQARALISRWPHPADRPPLFGILLGVKDIFHVDGFVTRAGSSLPPQLFAGRQGPAVMALLDAGALIVGKTVTAEFACAEPGPTRNPHGLEHTPGGSSSGSAAAVASGTCLLALGTQTVGSVIRPAAFCGVAGLKPSFGRIGSGGVVYYSRSADHVGLFAQDVEALRAASRVVYGHWRPSLEVPDEPLPVIGVPEGPYLAQATEVGLAELERQLKVLAAAGYEIRRIQAFGDIAEINRRHRRLTSAEFAAEHSEWFADQEQAYRPRTLAAIRDGMNVPAAELGAAREGQLELRARLMGQMVSAGIDLWASPPATGPAPEGIGTTGDPIMNLPWTHAGLPVVTVPGQPAASGLPLGVQLAAAYGADERLLTWAEGIAAVVGRE